MFIVSIINHDQPCLINSIWSNHGQPLSNITFFSNTFWERLSQYGNQPWSIVAFFAEIVSIWKNIMVNHCPKSCLGSLCEKDYQSWPNIYMKLKKSNSMWKANPNYAIPMLKKKNMTCNTLQCAIWPTNLKSSQYCWKFQDTCSKKAQNKKCLKQYKFNIKKHEIFQK